MSAESVEPPEMDAEEYAKTFGRMTEEKNEEFEKLSKTKLIISLIGDANVGKSTTINALTGRKLEEVNPISGWTKKIALHPYEKNVFIVDTPGLNDTKTADLTERTQEFVEKDTDIILFFVNAASNRSQEEANAFRSILKLEKPTVVVFNKIDTISGVFKEEVMQLEVIQPIVDDLKKRFGYELIVPISAEINKNVETLSNTIADILSKKGKDLLFLKISKYKNKRVTLWIRGASIAAAGIGALPIPGSDIIPLTSLQVGLCLRIAYIYDCKVTKGDAMNLISSTVTGGIGKTLFRSAIKLIGNFTGVGVIISSAVGASIAASMTYGLGWAANEYYKSGMTMDLGEVGETYKKAYESYKGDFRKTS